MKYEYTVLQCPSSFNHQVKIYFFSDASSIASSIEYHAEFTPLFSPEKFDLPKAFFATAQSICDALIIPPVNGISS
ncbi:hypothetical protein COLO4_25418, partial [Corchorus olitorius]